MEYSKYKLSELDDILDNIKKEKFPDRYNSLVTEINKKTELFKNNDRIQITESNEVFNNNFAVQIESAPKWIIENKFGNGFTFHKINNIEFDDKTKNKANFDVKSKNLIKSKLILTESENEIAQIVKSSFFKNYYKLLSSR